MPTLLATFRASRGMGWKQLPGFMRTNSWPNKRSQRLVPDSLRAASFQAPKRCSPLLIPSKAIGVYRRTVWNGVSRPRPDDRLQNLNRSDRNAAALRNQAALPGGRGFDSLVRIKRFLRVPVRTSRSNDSVVSGARRPHFWFTFQDVGVQQ